MSTQLQLRRGNTAQTAVFTGAVGEVTVITDQNTITVHDGITAGGHIIATGPLLQAAWNQANASYNQANATNTYAGSAYGQANATNTYATSGYNQANVATTLAQAGYNQANVTNTYANSGYNVANTANANIIVLQGEIDSANANISVLFGIETTQNTNISAVNNYATSAYGQANSAYGQAIATNNYATSGYGQANTATTLAQASYNQANATNTYATSGYNQANATNTYATSAYGQANTATTLAQASYNQANATNTYATSGYNQANATNTYATTAYGQANATNTYATSAYGQANTATTLAQASYNQANATNTYATTAYGQANVTNTYATSGYNQANIATTLAQASFNNSNTKFNSSGGTISGNVTINGSLSVTGNIVYTGNVTTQVISGNTGEFFGYSSNGFNALYAGIPTGFVVEPDTVIQASTNINGYAQVNHQNINNGTNASTDFVATADNGTGNDTYIDMGINSSTYNQAGFTLNNPNDGYLYVSGNTTTGGGNLIVATMTNKDIIFATNGQNLNNEVARITTANTVVIKSGIATTSISSGSLQVIGGVGVQGDIQAQNIYSNGTNIVSYFQGVEDTQNTNITATNTYATSGYNQANATNTYATSGYNQANATNTYATSGYNQANATNTYATSAYGQANTATTLAQASFNTANSIPRTFVYGTSGQVTANASTGNVQLGLATTGVTSGSYVNTIINVDTYGRITSAANGSTNTLTSGANTVQLQGKNLLLTSNNAISDNNLNLSTNVASQIVDTFSYTQFLTAKYLIQAVNNTDIHATEVLITTNGVFIDIIEYGVVYSNNLISVNASLDSTNSLAQLVVTPVNSNTVITFIRNALVGKISS